MDKKSTLLNLIKVGKGMVRECGIKVKMGVITVVPAWGAASRLDPGGLQLNMGAGSGSSAARKRHLLRG